MINSDGAGHVKYFVTNYSNLKSSATKSFERFVSTPQSQTAARAQLVTRGNKAATTTAERRRTVDLREKKNRDEKTLEV